MEFHKLLCDPAGGRYSADSHSACVSCLVAATLLSGPSLVERFAEGTITSSMPIPHLFAHLPGAAA